MEKIIYANGTAKVLVPAGQKIAIATYGNEYATLSFKRGNNLEFIQRLDNAQVTLGPWTDVRTVNIEAAQDPVSYDVGSAPFLESNVRMSSNPFTGEATEISTTKGTFSLLGSLANTVALLGDSITAQNYFYATPSGFSASGNVVTVASTAHGLAVGDPIRVTTLNQADFNGDFTVATRINANSYTYNLPATASTASPTGTGRVYVKKLMAANGYFMHANALLGGRLRLLSVEGVPGETLSQILARVPAVTALRPKYAVVLGGTNDIRSSANTVQQMFDTLVTIWAQLQASGAIVYAMSVPPLGTSDTPPNGLTVNQCNSNVAALNERIKAYCATNSGLVFVDAHAAIVDNTALTGVALAAKLEDQIHPSPRGAYAIGKALFNAMRNAVKEGNTLASSPADTLLTFAASTNVTENPCFIQGAGGTLAGGATGTVGEKWRVQQFGTAAVVASLVPRTDLADGDSLGNWQRMNVTFSANNDSAQLDSVITLGSRVAAGDQLYVECALKLSNTPANLKRLNASLNYTVGGVSYSTSIGYGTISNNLQLEDGSWVFRTPTVTMPGVPTAATLVVFIQAAGAAPACNLDVGRAVVRNVVG